MNRYHIFERRDKDLISVFADDELNYWSAKWGVSKEAIKSAVRFSGCNSVSKVYNYLTNTNKLRFS